MFNPNKLNIRFLEDDDQKISDAFWKGVEQALESIYDGTGIRYQSYTDYRCSHPVALVFAYYFHPSHRHNGNIGEISKQALIEAYEWSCSIATKHLYEERVKGICLLSDESDTREILSKGEGATFGLRLVLLSMRNQGILLLPAEFKLPITNKWLYGSTHLNNFFPPLAQFFLSFHAGTPKEIQPTDNPVFQYYLAKSSVSRKRSNWFSSLALAAIISSSANTVSELSIRDCVRANYLRNRRKRDKSLAPMIYKDEDYTTTPIPWKKMLEALVHEYGDQLRFSVVHFHQLLTSYRNAKRHKASWVARREKAAKNGDKRKLERPLGGKKDWTKKKHYPRNEKAIYIGGRKIRLEYAIELIMPTDVHEMSVDDMYEHCINIDTGFFSPQHIQHTLQHIPWRVDEEVVDYWVEIIQIYKKTRLKKQQGADQKIRHIGGFFLYLFFYLPRWFDHNPTTILSYPKTVDVLDPVIYGSTPIEADKPVPKTFVAFMEDREQARSLGSATQWNYLNSVYQLFEWLQASGHKYILKGCSNPQLLFDKDDLPITTSRRGTVKNIFPKRLFKTAVSYAYAVLEFKTHIQERLEKEEITYADLGTRGKIIKTSDLGLVPKVSHHGREYDVVEIPSIFLKLENLKYKDGRRVNTIHLGPAIHNVLALETGLRARHIQWLDDTEFDKHVEDHELKRSLYPLSVKTDKRGHTWTPFVSARVISLLRSLSTWKNSVADPKFHVEVDYTHKKTHYGKFNSVFSTNNGVRPGPISDGNYRDSWDALCFGLQLFLRKHELDDILLVKYVPRGAKKWKHRYSQNETQVIGEEDESWADAACTPVSLRLFVTSHGARASVVSQNISILPADIIGKYLTGQTERVVYYYAKLTMEDIDELAQTQSGANTQFQTPVLDANAEPINSAEDAVMLHCKKVNRELANSVNNKEQLNQVIECFGMISLDSLNDQNQSNPTGIELIRNSNASEIAYNDSHICPFGNTCPKEIINQFGEMRLCGICAYSIKSVDHLPAIAAAKNAALERLEGLTQTLEKAIKQHANDDVITDIEHRRDNQALNALGWELTAEILHCKVQDIQAGKSKGLYTSFEPEFVSNYLRKIHVENDEANYLICRLNECIEYPSLESEEVKTRFELAKRKLLAASGNLAALLDSTPSSDPTGDLYSLLSSMKDVKQLDNAQILAILRSEAGDFLPNTPVEQSLLGAANG